MLPASGRCPLAARRRKRGAATRGDRLIIKVPRWFHRARWPKAAGRCSGPARTGTQQLYLAATVRRLSYFRGAIEEHEGLQQMVLDDIADDPEPIEASRLGRQCRCLLSVMSTLSMCCADHSGSSCIAQRRRYSAGPLAQVMVNAVYLVLAEMPCSELVEDFEEARSRNGFSIISRVNRPLPCRRDHHDAKDVGGTLRKKRRFPAATSVRCHMRRSLAQVTHNSLGCRSLRRKQSVRVPWSGTAALSGVTHPPATLQHCLSRNSTFAP